MICVQCIIACARSIRERPVLLRSPHIPPKCHCMPIAPSPRVYGMMRRAAVVATVLIARSPDDRRLAFVTRCNPSRTNRNGGSRRTNYCKCGSCLLCRLLRAAIPPKKSKNVPGARKGDTVPYPLTPSSFSVDCFIFLFLDDQAPPRSSF